MYHFLFLPCLVIMFEVLRKMKRGILLILCLIILGVTLDSCIEEFEAATQTFESALVVEGIVTDEEKQHRVSLSRAFRLDEEVPQKESGATVRVEDDQGNTYPFSEGESGIYSSNSVFAAQPGVKYELFITTGNGRSYRSKAVQTPDKVSIDGLSAVRESNDFEQEGVSILLDNGSTGGESKYFRYEYEETYKIIAPRWTSIEFVIIDDEFCADGDGFEVGVTDKEREERVCYNTVRSVDVIQATTLGLDQNTVTRFPVRFLNRNNYIISHRYSILVRQFSQTRDAFDFLQNLDDFSSSENVFSNVQPGFIEGNIDSMDADEENVLGYFEVASVSSQRLYFNYTDLFPDESLPPYAVSCDTDISPLLTSFGAHCDGPRCDGNCRSPLIEAIRAGLIKFVDINVNEFPHLLGQGPYIATTTPCGDCTVLGSNVVPEFWVEE